jgi:chromate reductase
MIQIIGISGSLRDKSYNTALLNAIKEGAPGDTQIEIVSIKDIPLYNEDNEKRDGIPEPVTALKEKIARADALLIATPEYNHGIPGVLKNAIDWMTRPTSDVKRIFANRKTAIVGASVSRLGTAFAQTAWLPVLRYLNTHTYFGNQIFVAAAQQVFDADGKLTDDQLKALIHDFITDFVAFIKGDDKPK